jgi:hypothetical protein
MSFYTYMHMRADDGMAFYVGKGSVNRSTSRHHRNSHWHSTVKKHGIKVIIAANWEQESEAFGHEELLIACFRDIGHPLCNRTEGGEGAGHYIRTPETRAKYSAIHKGKSVSLETRAKISASKLGKKTQPCSEEKKARIAAAQKGVSKPFGNLENATDKQRSTWANLRTPTSFSAESRSLMSIAKRGKPWTSARRKAYLEGKK